MRPLGLGERWARERQEADRKRWPATCAQDCETDGFWWDEAAADRVADFFAEYLVHVEGEWAGSGFVLDEWQTRWVMGPLFGWKREDGTRRFRYAYLEIPRKNGKSALGAGVGLYLTVADGEPGAQVYSSATKKDQAKIVHGVATQMVKRSPRLKRQVGVRVNNLHCATLASRFEPLGADADTLDGLNPHANIVDELHAHRDRRAWDVLTSAMGARRQPLNFVITTAGEYDPESIGWEQHQYALAVLDPDDPYHDETFFAYVCAADPKDDWADPETWAKANPGLGVSVKEGYLREECEKAKRSPRKENSFKRYHLNVWTEQAERWLSAEGWEACALPVPPEAELIGMPCIGGLDLAATTDLTAFVLVFRMPDGSYALLPRFWVPEDGLEDRARRDRAPYREWVDAGYIETCPGPYVDYSVVRSRVVEDAERFDLLEVPFDPWNATGLAVTLEEEDGVAMVQHRQGTVSMNEPCKLFEKLVLGGKIRHGGHPVLRWMANNLAVKEDASGNLRPDKKRSTARIDGIVAAIMGVGRHELGERETQDYVYGGL